MKTKTKLKQYYQTAEQIAKELRLRSEQLKNVYKVKK